MVLNETQGEADNLPQLINCDWLQFWCHYTTFDPERWSRETNYKCKNTHRGTRVFAEVWNVTEKAAYTSSRRDEPFAVMACRPYSTTPTYTDVSSSCCTVSGYNIRR